MWKLCFVRVLGGYCDAAGIQSCIMGQWIGALDGKKTVRWYLRTRNRINSLKSNNCHPILRTCTSPQHFCYGYSIGCQSVSMWLLVVHRSSLRCVSVQVCGLAGVSAMHPSSPTQSCTDRTAISDNIPDDGVSYDSSNWSIEWPCIRTRCIGISFSVQKRKKMIYNGLSWTMSWTHIIVSHFMLAEYTRIGRTERANFTGHRLLARVLSHMDFPRWFAGRFIATHAAYEWLDAIVHGLDVLWQGFRGREFIGANVTGFLRVPAGRGILIDVHSGHVLTQLSELLKRTGTWRTQEAR